MIINFCSGSESQQYIFTEDDKIKLSENQGLFLVFLYPFLRMLILPSSLATSNLGLCVVAETDQSNVGVSVCPGDQRDRWILS